jgi:Secretion system C-terminal sorting domain
MEPLMNDEMPMIPLWLMLVLGLLFILLSPAFFVFRKLKSLFSFFKNSFYMKSVVKPLALCAFLVANVLQLTAQCTVVTPQTTSRILYTSPVFIPPTYVNPSARLPSGALVYATGTYVDRIKSRLNPICDSLVYTVSVITDASCRVPDSLRVVKIHQLVTARGAVTGWNLLTPYSTWNGVVMNAAGCVDSVKIQRDTTVCVQRGGNHTVTLHVLPSLPGAEYAWYRRGQLVALTTDRILTINNIQPSDTGSYSVTLTVPGLPVGVINGVQVKFCCVPSTSHTYRTVSQLATPVAWCNQNYTSSGNYTCTLQNVNGCDSFAILHLTVLPCNMTVTIAQFGNQLNALAVGGVRAYRYLWSTGDTTSSIPLNGSGNYGVTVTDAVGCTQPSGTGFFSPLRSDYRLDSMTVPCNSNVGSGCTPIVLKTAVTGVKAYAIRLKFDATKVKPDSIIKHTLGTIIPTGANLFQYVSGDTLTLLITLTGTQNISGPIGSLLVCISWSSVSNFVPNAPVFNINGTIEAETANALTTHALESTGRIVSASSILLWNLYHGTQMMTFSSATNPTTILSGTRGNMVSRGMFGSGGTFLLSPLNDNYLQIKRNSTSIVGMPAIGGLDARYTSMIVAGRTIPNLSVAALIAMDVNGDGRITAGDITDMQIRAVTASTGFVQSNVSGNVSWRHFPKSWLAAYPAGKRAFQLSGTFPADDGLGISRFRVPQIDSIFQPDAAYLQRCDTTSMDITSILLGDASNDYLLDANAGAKGKLSTNITIDGRNATRSNNNGRDTFRIPVYADSTMGGLDLKIENYSNNVQIVSVVKGHSSVELLASINAVNKTCYISAYSTAQDGTSPNTPLCYINVITNCPFPSQFGQVTGYLDGKKSGTDIALNICTPVDPDPLRDNIQIFPNPTNNSITVQHAEITPKTIQVFNTLGRLMREVEAGNASTMVDLSDFAKGVYFIKVDNYTQRVVKQ